jgi:hypothetical protein
MGFYEHNSLGKFNAEIKSDLPSFGAEHLTGRPGSAGELDFKADEAADITNYSPDNFSRFNFDDAVDVEGDGIITSRSDRGFHFTVDSDADLATQPVTISKDTNTYTWDLAPGDQLRWSHVGSGTNSNTEVTLEKADGTEVKTDLPWMITDSTGSQTTGSFDPQQKYQIALGLPVAADTGNGSGNGNDGTGNGGDDTPAEETNWAVWGGVGLAALVGVGILMSKRK